MSANENWIHTFLKMSLLPYKMTEFQGISKPIFHTGWEMHPSEWLHALGSLRPWANAGDHIAKKTFMGPDGFQISLDVQHFTPSEITVQTIDNFIVIEAKHEERQDEHSYVSRHFQRRYRLPEGFNIEDVVSTISSDGILTVKVPKPLPSSEKSDIRRIQIHQTGPARLNVADKKEAPVEKSVIISK